MRISLCLQSEFWVQTPEAFAKQPVERNELLAVARDAGLIILTVVRFPLISAPQLFLRLNDRET